MSPLTAVSPREALPPRIVLFDGVCGFCDGAVNWMLRSDLSGRFRFATLQGGTAEVLRRRHPQIPRDIDTVVYVESDGADERVYLRSEAIFRIARQIDGPWRRLSWLGGLPRWLTDAGYALFARVRYRLFGKRDSCRMPTPEDRDRFLP